ncbi:MAG: PGF-CTERM sorting domain-containing protein [Chloroflexota bacterium]|nr:PGF-CTERM sorting domain-containing protein [Chloroflexota bacterium]
MLDGINIPPGFEAVVAAMALATVLTRLAVAWLRQARPLSRTFPLLVSVPVAALMLMGVLFVGGSFSARNAVASLLLAFFVAGGSTFTYETEKSARPGLKGGADGRDLPPLEVPSEARIPGQGGG